MLIFVLPVTGDTHRMMNNINYAINAVCLALFFKTLYHPYQNRYAFLATIITSFRWIIRTYDFEGSYSDREFQLRYGMGIIMV